MKRQDGMSRRGFFGAAGAACACGAFGTRASAVDTEAGDVEAGALDAITAWVEAQIEAGTVPGIALVATRNGEPFYECYRGTYTSSTGETLEYGPGVQSILLSFSKGVSATVAAMKQQHGLFAWDDPVVEYIPGFGRHGKESVTLRHLMTHSAGIPNVELGPAATEAQWQEAVQAICDAELAWPPGSKTQYHALTGLFTMAEVIRRVSDNKPWPQIARETLFAPIGADTMTFAKPPASEKLALAPPVWSDYDETRFAGHPAGACIGTPDDMLRVLNLNLDKGQWQDEQLLSEAAWKKLHTVQYAREIQQAREAGEKPAHEPWGLGWLLRGEDEAGGSEWFGFHDVPAPGTFGHAGVDSVIGVGHPPTGVALAFITTASPPDEQATIRLRNAATNQVLAAAGAELHADAAQRLS